MEKGSVKLTLMNIISLFVKVEFDIDNANETCPALNYSRFPLVSFWNFSWAIYCVDFLCINFSARKWKLCENLKDEEYVNFIVRHFEWRFFSYEFCWFFQTTKETSNYYYYFTITKITFKSFLKIPKSISKKIIYPLKYVPSGHMLPFCNVVLHQLVLSHP